MPNEDQDNFFLAEADSLQQGGIVQGSSCIFYQHFWKSRDSPTSAQFFFFLLFMSLFCIIPFFPTFPNFAFFPYSLFFLRNFLVTGEHFPDLILGWGVQGDVPVGETSLEGPWI